MEWWRYNSELDLDKVEELDEALVTYQLLVQFAESSLAVSFTPVAASCCMIRYAVLTIVATELSVGVVACGWSVTTFAGTWSSECYGYWR